MSTVLSEPQVSPEASRRCDRHFALLPLWLDRIGLPLLLASSLSTMVAAALA